MSQEDGGSPEGEPQTDGGSGGGGGSGGDGGSGGGQEPLTQGATVARIAVETPDLDEFVLRATLPVPAKTYQPATELNQLAIVDANGSVLPSQIEVVSRYADTNDGADVVELISRVRPQTGVNVGDLSTYDVVVSDHPVPTPPVEVNAQNLVDGVSSLPTEVRDFVTTPSSILIQAEDVFGHQYFFNPFGVSTSKRWERYGDSYTQLRSYGQMIPNVIVGGPTGTLPHFLGVHAYLGVMEDEPFVTLDLRINNGPDGFDDASTYDDPLGKVYFRSLQLIVPTGWMVQQNFEDPGFGNAQVLGPLTSFPLVDEISTGDMHVIGPNAQFHRRLVLSPIADQDRARAYADAAGQGFSQRGEDAEGDELWSWWNADTGRYFPQRQQLPVLDHVSEASLRANLSGDFAWHLGFMESGTGYGVYPVQANRLGWAHPYGVPYGGMTGGNEIHFFTGVDTALTASTDGYRDLQLVHRMHTDRQPNAYFNLTGDSTSLEQWTEYAFDGDPYINMVFFLSLHWSGNDPMGYDSVDTTQADQVNAMGLVPDYETELLSFAHHDLPHLIRYTRSAKALAWLGNDPIAKDDLIHQAEMVHLTYHMQDNNEWGGYNEVTMKYDRVYVDDHPQSGYRTGRQEGWGIDTMNAAYSLSNNSWRDLKLDFYDDLTDLVVDGQGACNGFLQSNIQPKFLGGKYRARQSIEQAIMENALWGAVQSVYRDVSPAHETMLEDVLVDSFYAMTSEMAWGAGQWAPWTYTAVGPLDESLPVWCNISEVPADGHTTDYDGFQIWNSLAWAYELTGDTHFLNYLETGLGGTLPGSLIDDGLDHFENRIGLHAMVESL